MAKPFTCPPGQNILLHTLSPDDRAALDPHLRAVPFEVHQVVETPGAPIADVIFPTGGVGSTIAIGAAGRRIEAGLFGREGMSGTTVVMGGESSPHETFVQVAGHGLAIEADRLRELMAARPTLHAVLLRYVQVLLLQTGQTALSNGHAKLEERLARWLLMCHDRVAGDSLALTHEFMAVMLGVRRAGVTVGTHILEGKGLIRAGRGQVTVLDREGLEEEASGSYGLPEREYRRLFA